MPATITASGCRYGTVTTPYYGRQGDTALDPAITAATWQRFFDSDEPVHALVAEHEGRLVGLTHYLFHRSTTSIAPVCYLQDLFTSEAARGRGVARALIEDVYARAGEAGSPRVYWRATRPRGGSTTGSPSNRASSSIARCSDPAGPAGTLPTPCALRR